MAKTKKSANFDRNLDPEAMRRDIEKNVLEVAIVAGENSNNRAPLDTGALRQSRRLQREAMNNLIQVSNIWQVFGKAPRRPRSRNPLARYPQDYAHVRYLVNKKNPQTTEWAKKDLAKNHKKYLEMINRGVIK